MGGVHQSLAAVVDLRGAFLDELVQLHHHAVAAHLHGAHPGRGAQGHDVHRRALHYELYRRRRCVKPLLTLTNNTLVKNQCKKCRCQKANNSLDRMFDMFALHVSCTVFDQ